MSFVFLILYFGSVFLLMVVSCLFLENILSNVSFVVPFYKKGLGLF